MWYHKTLRGWLLRRPEIIVVLFVSGWGAFAAEPDSVHLSFPSADVRTVLEFYERMTGRKVWLSTNVAPDAKVDLITEKPVPRAEAIRLLRLALLESGGLEMRETDKEAFVTRSKDPKYNVPAKLPTPNTPRPGSRVRVIRP